MLKNDLKRFESRFPEKTQFKHLKDRSIFFYLENGDFVVGLATPENGEVSATYNNANSASEKYHQFIATQLEMKCPMKRTIDFKTMDIINKENHGFYAGGELEEILCFTCDDGTDLCCSFDSDGKILNNPFG